MPKVERGVEGDINDDEGVDEGTAGVTGGNAMEAEEERLRLEREEREKKEEEKEMDGAGAEKVDGGERKERQWAEERKKDVEGGPERVDQKFKALEYLLSQSKVCTCHYHVWCLEQVLLSLSC